MTGKEKRIEELRDELVDFMDTMTEKSFDEQHLNEILSELDELDPIPLGTFKSTEESLKEFWEKYGHFRNLLSLESNDVKI